MNESYSEDVTDWSFPNLDISINSELMAEVAIDSQNNAIRQDDFQENNVQHNQIQQQEEQLVVANSQSEQLEPSADQAAIAVSKLELEILKSEYEKKLEILNNTINRLEKSVDVFDREIIEAIQLIIKKIVKKIIYKELESDPNLILAMIKELSEFIQPKNSVISIALSAADYKRLDIKDPKLAELISVDNSFAEGDIAVKTDFTEVRAKLSDRIDQIMGDNHD